MGRSRGAGSRVFVAPHGRGELAAGLWALEDLVGFVEAFDRPGRRPGIGEVVRRARDPQPGAPGGALPAVLASGAARRAVAELAREVGRQDLSVPAVKPVGGDGGQLVAIVFAELDEDSASALCELAEVLQAGAGGSGRVGQALRAKAQPEVLGRLVNLAGRVAAVLAEGWTPPERLLAERLSDTGSTRAQVVLEGEDRVVYDRVARRLVASWHRGDALEAQLYGCD